MRKNMKTALSLLSVMLIASCFSFKASAHKNMDEGWKERIKAEKVAFLTSEIGLTPEEAQVFWPVYNEISQTKKELQAKVKESYMALIKALNEDNTTDKEIDKLLDEYLAAKQAVQDAGKGNAAKYRKVLSSKKVAKLYIAEEKFRRQNIRNLKGHKPHGGPHAGPQGHQHRGPQGCPPAGKPAPGAQN